MGRLSERIIFWYQIIFIQASRLGDVMLNIWIHTNDYHHLNDFEIKISDHIHVITAALKVWHYP